MQYQLHLTQRLLRDYSCRLPTHSDCIHPICFLNLNRRHHLAIWGQIPVQISRHLQDPKKLGLDHTGDQVAYIPPFHQMHPSSHRIGLQYPTRHCDALRLDPQDCYFQQQDEHLPL